MPDRTHLYDNPRLPPRAFLEAVMHDPSLPLVS
jgi:hypothetical protein